MADSEASLASSGAGAGRQVSPPRRRVAAATSGHRPTTPPLPPALDVSRTAQSAPPFLVASEAVRRAEAKVELGEVKAAEALFSKLEAVYTAWEQAIPTDRSTLLEHVHQSLMYGKLMMMRLKTRLDAVDARDELVEHLQGVVNDHAAEIQELNHTNSDLRQQVHSAEQAMDRLQQDVHRLERELADAQLNVQQAESKMRKHEAQVALRGRGVSPDVDKLAPNPSASRSRRGSMYSVEDEDEFLEAEFDLQETERRHHRTLLESLNDQLRHLQERLNAEAALRQALEGENSALIDKYVAVVSARNPSHAASSSIPAAAGLVGRLLRQRAPSDELRVFVGDLTGGDGDGSLLGEADLTGAGAASSTGEFLLPQAGEVLESVQSFVCEVGLAVAGDGPASAIGGLPDQDGSEPDHTGPATSASGMLREVHDVFRQMLEVGTVGASTTVLSGSVPNDRSARCLHFLTLLLRLQRLLGAAGTDDGPMVVPPAAVVMAASYAARQRPLEVVTESVAGSALGPSSRASTPQRSRTPMTARSTTPSLRRSTTPMRMPADIGSVTPPFPATAPNRSPDGQVSRRTLSPRAEDAVLSESPSGRLYRDFSPRPQRPVRGLHDVGGGGGGGDRLSSTSTRSRMPSDASDLAFVVVRPGSAGTPVTATQRLARDPSIGYTRLTQFYLRSMSALWQQFSRITSIAATICSFATNSAVTPPRWVPDRAVGLCGYCSSPFSLTVRRHHCRCCGSVFCGRCSSKEFNLQAVGLPIAHPPGRVPIDGAVSTSERVCEPCYFLLRRLPALS